MNWIYSLVFTGLFLSSGGDQPAATNSFASIHTAPAETRTLKDETERFEQSYKISPNGRVSVSNVNGSIEVVAWDKNEVRLEAIKTADSKESLADVELQIDSRPDSFRVEAEYKKQNWNENPQRNRYNIEVQFKLSVPRTAVLDEIETVNGSVTASNFVNLTKISAVNGSVNAVNLRGTANLSTVNGTVTADFDRLESGSKVNLSTVNGRINLSIPSDANATIKADSLNGGITNGFGLPVRKGEYVGRDLHGRLGSGDAAIKLNSVNGPLAINKKDDGRTISPAQNLLPAKGEGDRWDNNDTSEAFNNAKTQREISKAIREADRASAQAMREAEREMRNIRVPELNDLKVEIGKVKIDEAIKIGLKAQADALSGMRDAMWLGSNTRVELKSNSFAVKGESKVTIVARGANVKVKGWDKPEVKYVLTEIPDTPSGKPVSIKETQTDSGITLTVTDGTQGDQGWIHDDGNLPRLEVYVPRKTNLKVKSAGEIRLEGVSGEIDLDGSDQSIDVRRSDGKLTVANSDGIVRVIGFRGDVTARTSDGEVYLDGDFSSINASASDGKYILTLPESVDADISAKGSVFTMENLSNGKELSDNNWRFGKGGRKYTFTSSDGSVELRNRNLLNANN